MAETISRLGKEVTRPVRHGGGQRVELRAQAADALPVEAPCRRREYFRRRPTSTCCAGRMRSRSVRAEVPRRRDEPAGRRPLPRRPPHGRGDRAGLARGARFDAWSEHFQAGLWWQALADAGIDVETHAAPVPERPTSSPALGPHRHPPRPRLPRAASGTRSLASAESRESAQPPAAHAPYRLLAIDIDGTLVNSRDELTPAAAGGAGPRRPRAGIRVVLATGRRYRRTLHLVEPLGIDVPLVTASGALVKDPADHRDAVSRRVRPRRAARRRWPLIDRCGFDAVLCADTYRRGVRFLPGPRRGPRPGAGRVPAAEPGLRAGLAGPGRRPAAGVFHGLCDGHRARRCCELRTRCTGHVPGQLSTHVLRSPRYSGFLCELARRPGVTKWSAIRRLAGRWGIDDEAICAVGDDVNDIPMIRAAGPGRGDGQRPARGQGRRRPHRPHPRRRRTGRGRRAGC